MKNPYIYNKKNGLKYFFHIAYHGFQYRGWQRQQGVCSVQEVLEDALEKVLKEKLTVFGCGRTDAQVSASQYFFHIETLQTWDYDLVFRLNKVLPQDIAIFEIIPVDDKAHARYSVKERTYDYFIHTYKDPFLAEMSSMYLLKDLDFEKMKAAVALLTRYDNFYAFCKSPEKHNHTICKVSRAELYRDANGDRLRLQISANRFLKSMIRMLMGMILEIGKGTCTVEEFEESLRTQRVTKIIVPAHPQGLYLSGVKYDFLNREPRTAFNSMLASPMIEWLPV
jgi:tRNA pseudouridine38-40 synthase